MKHYINDETGKKYGYPKDGTREMTDAELLLSQVTPLDDLKQAKIFELSAACDNQIVNTLFESSALGSVHSYDCRIVEQINLTIAVLVGGSSLIHAHTQPAFSKIEHTHDQCLVLLNDMQGHIEGAKSKYQDLLAEVNAITNDNAGQRKKLAEITW